MMKARIPTVALATLVFGGACGDDSDGNGIDVSEERVQKLSKDICENFLSCDFESDAEVSQAECERAYNDYFEAYSKLTDDCFDAILDYYECYAQLECSEFADIDEEDEDEGPCDDSKVEALCGDQLAELDEPDDEESSDSNGG